MDFYIAKDIAVYIQNLPRLKFFELTQNGKFAALLDIKVFVDPKTRKLITKNLQSFVESINARTWRLEFFPWLIVDVVHAKTPVGDALRTAQEKGLDFLAVIDDSRYLIGVLDARKQFRSLASKMLSSGS